MWVAGAIIILIVIGVCMALLRGALWAELRAIDFQQPPKARIPWVVLSVGLIFASAYFAGNCIAAIGPISGWTGLPQYAAELQRIELQVWWWEKLALLLPFLAALTIGLGPKRPASSPEAQMRADMPQRGWSDLCPARYLVRLAVSIAGTLGILLAIGLIDILCYELRIPMDVGYVLVLVWRFQNNVATL